MNHSESRIIDDSIVQAGPSRIQPTYDRRVLISETERLQEFILDKDFISSMLSDPQPWLMSDPMFHRLLTLILSPGCAALWLRGLSDRCYPSSMSTVATTVLSVLSEAIILVLPEAKPQLMFHSCTLPTIERPDISVGESGLISLLYAFITQLVYSLKPKFGSNINLEHERFATLDGTMASWPAALKLFEDLVSLSAPYIICVIDGIEWIECRRGSVRCRELLATLRDIMKGRENRVFKVLFTTAGNSGTLTGALDAEEIYQESSPKQGRKNRFQQTGQHMLPFTEL